MNKIENFEKVATEVYIIYQNTKYELGEILCQVESEEVAKKFCEEHEGYYYKKEVKFI